MVVQVKRCTAEEFDEFVNLSENTDKLFEFIGGEIVEVPSNPYSSGIAARISGFLLAYLRENSGGHVTGEGGGYMVSGERYVPNAAFISRARQPELARQGYNPNPPDLAVEVVSPTDTDRHLRIKITNYLLAGTVVWVVHPDHREVEVYVPGQPVKIVDVNGTLDGGEVLSGFLLVVKEIFPE